MKRFLHNALYLVLLTVSVNLFAQFNTATVNGTIAAAEYGTHTDGNNQQASGSPITYMTWDATNLYIGVSAANTAEGFVIYFDKDNLTPIDSGTNTNGTLVGNNYDGTNFAGLPFRADIVMYVKSGYREFRTADGANGWGPATAGFGSFAESGGTVREFSIPWTSFPGGAKPTAFNWFSYVTSSGGFVYGQVPTANAGGTIGTTARYERYYNLTNTATGTATKPMSRDCFVFNNTADENTFGAISVFDFTMNSTGRQIARVAGNWTITGTMRVNAGSVYYGSGGSYGNSTVTTGVVTGGLLDMDANNQTQAFTNTLTVSGGTLNIGNAANSVTVAAGISTVATALTISGTGTANISNGTLSIGVTGGGNQALNLSGGTLNLTSNGTININGNFTRPTGGGQFNQSGTSLLSIDGNSGTAASSITTGVPSFNAISATGTGLNCVAGTIRIVDPHHSSIGVSGPRAVSISYGTTAPTAYQFSGTHTFEFGNGSSVTGGNTDGFVVDNYVGTIRVPLNNVLVNSGVTANRWVTNAYTSGNGIFIKGNLTINASCEFRNTLASTLFTIEGNINNAGTLTSSQGITFASTPISGGAVVAATVAQTVSGAGVFRNLAAAPTAKFTNLTFNNSTAGSAVNFSIGDVTTTGLNTFTAGIVDIGNNNNYIFGTAATTARTSGYALIQGTGQMQKTFVTGDSAAFTFHVGENIGTTEYSPFNLDFSASSLARTIGVRPIDATHPNINDVDTQTDFISRYWQLSNSAAGTYTYGGTATYLVADINGTQTNMKPNLWTGASPWTQLVGSAAANVLTITAGATETTAPIGTTAEFTGRLKAPATYTWDQSASSVYGTAANWTPDRNAPASDDILIFDGSLTPTPTVTGFATQTIGKLLFINNANVNLQSTATATLTISGGAGTDLDIPVGSILNLSGTSSIGISHTGTTTAAIAGTLKTSTTGTGTLVFTNSTTTVTGTLDLSSVTNANTSTITNLLFSSGGTCIMGSTSIIIPIAGWNANSNLNITGIVAGTGATNNNQSFGNILYDCASQTSTVNFFLSSTVNIQGNVEIRNTGSGKFRFGSAPTINIAGNLSITNTANCDIANGAGSVNVSGNFLHSTTGTTDLAPSSSNTTLRVAGTFNQTAGTITESSTSTGSAIEFNGTVSQSVTTGTVTNNVNYRVNNATGIILPSTLNINTNALLRISNGTVTSGTVAYNATGTTLVYDAITPQTTTSLEFPTTNGPANLTINNSNATPNVTLHASRAITGVLALSAGRLVLGANDFTLGVASTVSGTPSATKMVVTDGSGQLKKVFATGASAFTFPVGETTGVTEYSPNNLNFTANDTQRTIGVKVIDATHPNINTGATPVDFLSRYWSFTDDQAGTYTYTGSFTYVTGGVDVNGTEAAIKVGRWDGTAWTQHTSSVASPVLTISSALNQTSGLLNGNDFSGRTIPNVIYTWTGATDSNWATNGNWDIAGFPNAANHQVVINTAGGNQPTIATGVSYTTSTITINNAAATLTLDGTASLTTGGLATITTGTVTLNGTSTLTTAGGLSNAGTIAVGTGYLNLQTSFANTGTITSSCAGTIEFGIPGGTIPQGITYGNLTVSGAGSFVFSAAGLVTVCGTYSQPGATTASTIVTLANSAQVNTMTVGGDLNVSGGNPTFTSILRFINSGSAASNATVSVTGNATVSGSGRIQLEATSSTAASASMTVGGNFTANGIQSGATGFVDFGSGTTIPGNGITIGGNFSVSNTASSYTSSSATSSGFVFTGVGKTFSNTSSVNSQYTQYTINSGASYQMLSGLTLPTGTVPTTTFTVNGTLDMGTNVITAANTTEPIFTLASGGTLKTANATGVQGSFSGFGAAKLVLSSLANYEFQGAATGVFTTTPTALTVNNLVVNNATAVTFSQNLTATNNLDFQTGLLTTGAFAVTVGASGTITNATSAKYVNGKLNRIYSSIGSKTFPVGKGGVYRPVTFEYTALTGTSTVSTEQIETALTGSLPASTNLNNARTWDISQTGGSAFIYKVTLDGTGDTVSGVVAMLKKESGTITSNAATTPNYTNTTDFTTLTGTNNFTLGSTCTVTSNAGSNQTSCAGSTFTLAANTPAFGTGAWTVTGPSNLTSQFSSTSSPTAIFTPAGGTGAYIATWTITNGSCSDATTVTLTSGGTTKTWTGSWSPSAPSGSTDSVIISANYTSAGAGAGSFSACTLTVDSGAVVSIASGDTVTLNGAITVSSGSFTLANNANLIQNTNVSNSGNISVARTTASLMRQDYVLWSSPVASQQLQSFSPSTLAARFYTYNSGTNQYVVVGSPSTTNFTASTGYLIRVPNNHPVTPTAWTGTFTGVPNNGDQGLTGLTSGLFYATGNPYPSAINANDFITNNSLTDPLYFWRKTNNTATSSYATYTTMGGVSNSPADPLALIPNGYIQVGQGFIAKTVNTTLNFTNALRVSNSGPFLRTMENRSRIWIDLNGADGAFGQILVGYMPGATAGNDGAIDGRFFGDSQTALTSTINDEEFIIQGRALPFETSDVVALGFKSEFAGSFTISLNHVDGLFEENNQNIYLKDNLTNITTDLRAGSYTFATEAGVFNNRFEIVYSTTLSVGQNTFNENSVVVYKQNQDLVINTGKIAMATVKVFDIQGRLLVEKKHINASETRINVGTTNQVLILKIDSESNGTVTKKVVN